MSKAGWPDANERAHIERLDYLQSKREKEGVVNRQPNYERSQYDARYAGNASIGFWERINALSGGARRELYSLGGALQNLEGFVLKALVEAEAEPPSDTK